MNFRNLLGILHRMLGKSRTFHAISLKVRNQVSAVISHVLNDGIAMETNGEAWLIGKIAPDARFFIDVEPIEALGQRHSSARLAQTYPA
jgi:hypothetical protein